MMWLPWLLACGFSFLIGVALGSKLERGTRHPTEPAWQPPVADWRRLRRHADVALVRDVRDPEQAD